MDTSFFGIGIPEIVFIVVIALIVLGPERLPSTMREIAKMWGYVRNLSRELTSQFGDELKVLDDINPQKLMREMVDTAEKEAKQHMDSLKSVTTTKTTTTVTTATATALPTAAPTEAEVVVESTTTETTVVNEVLVDPTPAAITVDSTAAPVEEVENRILPPTPKDEITDEVVAEATLDQAVTEPTLDEVVAEVPVAGPMIESQLVQHATAVSLNGASDKQENLG
ncbi:MAG: twin-arginine translocase TatA/TatE family subunit [Chloroflexi bacterium]|nr:twin-arginine translocase TatA/TatE family subunit [Chloroflexota bacterium]